MAFTWSADAIAFYVPFVELEVEGVERHELSVLKYVGDDEVLLHAAKGRRAAINERLAQYTFLS